MIDLVYWSRAMRTEREREAAKRQFTSRTRSLLRQPPAPLAREMVRRLLPEQGRRGVAPPCCMTGARA